MTSANVVDERREEETSVADKRRLAQITIGLPPDVMEELQRVAGLEGLVPGALIRTWVIRMLRETTPGWQPKRPERRATGRETRKDGEA